PGWWDNCIGPGKAMDTNKLFIVSVNNLGGCHGSTGPESLNPATQEPFGAEFPQVVVKDWVASQALLADHLNVGRFLAVIGGSLGGMQALQWSIDFPDRVANAILIATAPKLTAQNIAFNEIARQAITSDPEYRAGRYRLENTNPDHGLM
ncbi:MAG TPA: homoserine O-acetyltransferase, partial [Gammaproteobacteria bacterium]|nr:homoserine O-acetyltransferase [Gammaproteobacteria bacterium]